MAITKSVGHKRNLSRETTVPYYIAPLFGHDKESIKRQFDAQFKASLRRQGLDSSKYSWTIGGNNSGVVTVRGSPDDIVKFKARYGK